MKNNFSKQKKYLQFRPELQFTLVKDGEEKIYTLFDPHNDRYFQFKDYEYTISSLLDGNNTLDEVCQKFEKQFDAILPRETLDIFIKKLFSLGLISGAPVPPKKDKYSNLLFKKFKLFNPDKLFDHMIKYVSFVFKPFTVNTLFIIIIIAAYFMLKRWDELFNYGMPSWGNNTWLSYIIMGIVITAIISTHEFAHGLSLKYYGGKVPEIGFMLLLFLPAFYCDVTDAWKLPKNQKLFVTFAGGFYEVAVGAFAIIIWHFAEPHIWLADISYIIIVSSIFTIGINLNPLLRLDGYYLLSDFLEMPNLRSESIQYLIRLIPGISAKMPPKKYTNKEHFTYPLFGILSTLFIIFMIYIIYTLVAGWLIDTFRLTGVIISILILISLLTAILKGIIKPVKQPKKPDNLKIQ